MKNRIVIGLFVFIDIFLNSCDTNKKKYFEMEIYSKVEAKYKKSGEHMALYLVYNNKEMYVREWAKDSDLWQFVSVGDSIIKPPKSYTLRIKKPAGQYKDYEY